MTRFVTQQEPLISLGDHRMIGTQEHEDRARGTLLRKSITSVPLTGTGEASENIRDISIRENEHVSFSCVDLCLCLCLCRTCVK